MLFSFSRHLDVMHHHAYLTLHVFVKSKLFGIKIIFILLVWFYNKLSFFQIKTKTLIFAPFENYFELKSGFENVSL
jgi:hypothetical protein